MFTTTKNLSPFLVVGIMLFQIWQLNIEKEVFMICADLEKQPLYESGLIANSAKLDNTNCLKNLMCKSLLTNVLCGKDENKKTSILKLLQSFLP